MEEKSRKGKRRDHRVGVISAVSSWLKLLALIVLAVEAVLVFALQVSEPNDPLRAWYFPLMLGFLSIIVVGLFFDRYTQKTRTHKLKEPYMVVPTSINGHQAVGNKRIISYPTTEEIAECAGRVHELCAILAGGDIFFACISEALRFDHLYPDGHRPNLRILLRRSSRASERTAGKFVDLAKRFNINVDVRWYDSDFILRGYCFDRQFGYFSYFLYHDGKLKGRENNLMFIDKKEGEMDAFLVDMFMQTFDAHFTKSGSDQRLPSSSHGFFKEG